MEEINYKIRLYQKQFEDKPNLLDLCIMKCPLLCPALGIIGGILFYTYFSVPLACVTASIAILTFVVGLLIYKQTAAKAGLLWLCFLAFFVLGHARSANFQHNFTNAQSILNGKDQVLATIQAKLVSKPTPKSNPEWFFEKFGHRQKTASFNINVSAIQMKGRWVDTNFNAYAFVKDYKQDSDFNVGDKLEIYCWLKLPHPPDNKAQFDFAKYLKKKNIPLIASIKSPAAIRKITDSSSTIFKPLKSKILTVLNPDLQDEDQEIASSIISAITLGYRSEVPTEIIKSFQNSGLYHLLSLSGMHVGIIMSTFWYGLRHAGVSRKKRSLICIILTLVYLWIVPAKPPIIRACTICIIFFLGDIIYRRSNSINSLSFAALLLLLINPMNIYKVDFQLSFMAVLGIIIFSNMFINRIHLATNFWILKAPKEHRPLKLILKYFAVAFSASISAWIGGAGIIAYNFHTVNLLSPLWTVLIIPLFYVLLIAGFIKIGIALIFPSIIFPISFVCTELTKLFIWIVEIFSNCPFSTAEIPYISITLVLIIYSALLSTRLGSYYNKRWLNNIAMGIIFTTIVITLFPVNHAIKHEYKLSILSVGHGQAITLSTPDNHNYVFDCGSMSYNDIGRKIATPYLKENGINNIDSMFISHLDLDHYNGIDGILESFKIDKLYVDTHDSNISFIKELSRRFNIDVEPTPEQKFNESVKTTKIWPNNTSSTGNTKNHLSTVLLLEIMDKKIMIPGDIDPDAQKSILEMNSSLDLDILVLPHHGSRKTIWPEFVSSLKPEYILSSCSQSDLKHAYNSDLPNSIDYCTAIHGQIVISISKDSQISVETKKAR